MLPNEETGAESRSPCCADLAAVHLAEQPAAVRQIAETVLAAAFPMFVLLGPELRLIYNDSYVPILGPHHPQAMDQPFFSVWPEIKETIGPVIAGALAGQSTLFEDLPVTLHRNQREQAWFTFSYSPLRDVAGEALGVLCVCTETTEAVTSRRRQSFLLDLESELRISDDARQIIETAQAALGRHLGVSRVGYGSLDAAGRYFTTDRNWTDGSVPNHNGTHDLAAFGEEIFSALRSGESLAVEDTLTDPRAQSPQASAAFTALQVRSAATVSLLKGGRFVAAMYVHHHQPRRWSAEDVALIQDVAERTWSAAERAHAQDDLRAAANRQGFLLALSDRLRGLADAEEIKTVAAQRLGEHLHVGRVGYGEIDAAETHVTVARDWTDGTMASLGGETRPLEVFGPAIIGGLRAGRVLRLNSIADDPAAAPYAAGYESIGTRSLLIVPLIKQGRFSAILYLHEAEPRAWSEADAAIAHEVAERTWAAVERAQAEAALRELNATLEDRIGVALAERRLFAEMVETTDAPIQLIDREFRLLAINRAAQADYQRVFGVLPEVGVSLLELLAHDPEQRDAARAVWSRALAGDAFEQRAWWGSESERRRAYEMRFRPLHSPAGEIVGAYLIGNDVTELLQEQARLAAAEEQLRHSQKMEAMGQLTGGVAHDFNNLLTPIVGGLDHLQRKQVGGEREQRLIAAAIQSAERAKVLVQRLLAFARRQPLQPTAVHIGELVTGMADLVASTVGPQIRLLVEVQDDLPPSQAEANQLEMALLNLAVNARDAMPDGGRLTIAAKQSRVAGPHRSGLPAGDYIRLMVADTGSGMDEATLGRAVEPFFSTKGVGKGTGLGLSMVHGLAAQLGGALTIRSRVGLGTIVELWLPVSAADTATAESEARQDSATHGSGVALLVDDEDLVRMSTADMLEELGYVVVEASSADQALAELARGLVPALLVTDHLMPGMTGTELARQVRETRPEMRVLVISGYADVDGLAPELARLTKPFRKDELAAALAD